MHTHRSHAANLPVTHLVHLLRQLASVVVVLHDAHYREQQVREVSGSVGGHVRHSLDHIAALVRGLDVGIIDYDARVRGTSVETMREAALQEINRLVRILTTLNQEATDRHLMVTVHDAATGARSAVTTSLVRELAFVESHTIHHFAIVALLLHEMGIRVPPRFGYAPSTPSPELAA